MCEVYEELGLSYSPILSPWAKGSVADSGSMSLGPGERASVWTGIPSQPMMDLYPEQKLDLVFLKPSVGGLFGNAL